MRAPTHMHGVRVALNCETQCAIAWNAISHSSEPRSPRLPDRLPFQGNVIFYAQHATACCCRTCLEYWHAIPKGRPLTEKEIAYCEALIDLFLQKRLPKLKDVPIEKVLPLRRKTGEAEA